MMNFLCGPNGVLTAGVAVGVAAGFIWSIVDPRFRDNYPLGNLPVVFGGCIGIALASILSYFVTPAC
jgi:hypothetical protein